MAAMSTGLDCLNTVKYNGGRAAIHCKLYQFQSSYGYLMGHHQYGPKLEILTASTLCKTLDIQSFVCMGSELQIEIVTMRSRVR